MKFDFNPSIKTIIMKLLIVTQTVDMHDENLGFFHRWIEAFAHHYDTVSVIAARVGVHRLPPHVNIYSLGKELGSSRTKRLLVFLKIFQREFRTSDRVFFHMIPEFVLAASPFFIFSRKITALWYVHKSVTWKLKAAERLVDYVFSASPLSFRMLSKKVIYTGHAIDTALFSPAEESRHSSSGIRMLALGRLSPVKDYETIIQACARLKQSWDRPWRLSIVGGPLLERDNAYIETLKKLVFQSGLGQFVFFEGPRPYTEVPSLYRGHDLFISMSTTGSIDKAVLEAMSSGLTVITANEAFRDVLPYPYFLQKRSPEFLAERIKMLADENRPNVMLQEIVLAKHSLSKTIEKISMIMRQPL